LEAEVGRITVSGQKEKFSRSHLNGKSCHPSYGRKYKRGGSQSRPAWSYITRAKRAGDIAQVIQRLPHKLKALSSNPSIAKERRE
jgi:hypothetical protein